MRAPGNRDRHSEQSAAAGNPTNRIADTEVLRMLAFQLGMSARQVAELGSQLMAIEMCRTIRRVLAELARAEQAVRRFAENKSADQGSAKRTARARAA